MLTSRRPNPTFGQEWLAFGWPMRINGWDEQTAHQTAHWYVEESFIRARMRATSFQSSDDAAWTTVGT